MIDYQATVLELLELYKDNTVVMDIKIAADDGGKTIDIIVDDSKFKEDIYPRHKNGIPICVVRKHAVFNKVKA